MSDAINPPHYKSHPSGVECITVTEHMNFNRGNAIKYIWRAGDKGCEIQDLTKASWYINREIDRLEREQMQEYKSKPHTIRAFQFIEGQLETPEWFNEAVEQNRASVTIGKKKYITLYTKEGEVNRVQVNDWVCMNLSETIFRLTDEEFQRGFEPIEQVVVT